MRTVEMTANGNGDGNGERRRQRRRRTATANGDGNGNGERQRRRRNGELGCRVERVRLWGAGRFQRRARESPGSVPCDDANFVAEQVDNLARWR